MSAEQASVAKQKSAMVGAEALLGFNGQAAVALKEATSALKTAWVKPETSMEAVPNEQTL